MTYVLDASQIFTLFFIMIGPVKLIVPHAQETQALSDADLRLLSIRAALLSTAVIIIGAFAGSFLLRQWGVSIPSLMLAAGIIFFLSSLRIVMAAPVTATANTNAIPAAPSVMQIVFPMILTPHGIGVAIILLSASQSLDRTLIVVGMLIINILLDLLAMIWVRPILRIVTPAGMQILVAVLGTLMVALALQIMLGALREMGVITMGG